MSVKSDDASRESQAISSEPRGVARASLLVLGKGTVGGSLLGQIDRVQERLRERHGVDVRVVGAVDSRAALFDERGLPPSRVRELLVEAGGAVTGGKAPREPLEALIERTRRLPTPVLVDCTASDGMSSVYGAAFSRGVHVVTANKKPLAVPWSQREALFESQRSSRCAFRYETTVGASLPVVETLRNLVRTGDRVVRIEGSLSGTLGYLSNEVSLGRTLSSAVREAQSRGYTEPHPRDDLAGLDVARKALIFAREVGIPLELEDVGVEPFVPPELLVHESVHAFLEALEAYDVGVAEHVRRLRERGLVLRYLATVDPRARSAKVGPVAVPLEHPAAGLRGTEALVSFTTERYSDYPLVVRGAGAGGEVTAAGVLADVLAIARAF
jgi:aspartokinase/homoserine dehydrogenase 1